MKTIVVTCNRPTNYLAQCANSLKREGFAFSVTQGSRSKANLECLLPMDEANIQTLDFPEGFDASDVRYKSTLNYINALTLCDGIKIAQANRLLNKTLRISMANTWTDEVRGFLPNPAEPTYRLVLEDDVIACANLFKFISIYLSGLSPAPKVLNLYCALDLGLKEFGVAAWDINNFFGTQAMLYEESFASRLALYMREFIGSAPYDFLIREFCIKEGVKHMPTTSHSLFEHIGAQTTGLGFEHKAFRFLGENTDNLKNIFHVNPDKHKIQKGG